MANWKLVGGIAAGVLVIGGIGNALDDSNDKTSSTTADTTATNTPTTDKTSGSDDKTETVTVPNLVGKGLQSAQDQAQDAGFYSLTSHDALGRDRMQAFDRNWKVCSQSVAAGKKVSTDTKLDFGTVKLEEDCPAKDAGEPTVAGGKMPDFGGKSVKAARSALDSSTSITVTDASGEERLVFVESNWQVCGQTPKAGTELDGQPIKFTAVKFEESCP